MRDSHSHDAGQRQSGDTAAKKVAAATLAAVFGALGGCMDSPSPQPSAPLDAKSVESDAQQPAPEASGADVDVAPRQAPDVSAGSSAVDAAVEVTASAVCDDGADLPVPGSPCQEEGRAECTRVGEKAITQEDVFKAKVVNNNYQQFFYKACGRPNRVLCGKGPSGALQWQLAACPPVSQDCMIGQENVCRQADGGAVCCPYYLAGAPKGTTATSACDSDTSAKPACGTGTGRLWACTDYATAHAKWKEQYPQFLAKNEASFAACAPASPICKYQFPYIACPVVSMATCYKGGSIYGGSMCVDNYENAGPGCLKDCADYKKYTDLVKTP